MTIEFFQTKMGQRFYEGTMPQLIKVLERIAGALEKPKEGGNMKILVYHGKHGDEHYDISTDRLRGNAYMKLFDTLGGGGYYDGDAEPDEEKLFDKAAAGDELDVDEVIKFMQLRSDKGYEYERIEEIEPEKIEKL